MDRVLGLLADLIQIGTFLDFDQFVGKVIGAQVEHSTGFFLLIVLIAWYNSNRRKSRDIKLMQDEIDNMAAENRLLRQMVLTSKGLSTRDINRIFPPDDKRKSRRKK